MAGLTANPPKLAKAYRNLRQELFAATQEFAQEVQSGKFPTENQTFH
jgi:3-methyl-2-oxobutanoate hydroxymethyltransferase